MFEIGKKILIVDDDRFVREGLTELFLSRGFAVESAEDGYEAITRVENENFDLILLDLILPGISGIDTLKSIISIDPRANIIAMTAYSEQSVVARAMTEGAKRCFLKPMETAPLLSMVESALNEVVFARQA